ELVYSLRLPAGVVNAGVVVDAAAGTQIDPWFLSAKDENAVQGFAGTPVDVNELTYDSGEDVGAAGVSFPAAGTYYVAVDANRDRFTGRLLGGRYTLRSWVNDVTPPSLQLLTARVTAGRPTLVFRALDRQSGVDPESLTVAYAGALVSVGRFERSTGLAFFPLPAGVDALRAGSTRLHMAASDFQEAKNVDTMGSSIMPNTRTRTTALRVVAGVTVDWLLPAAGVCAGRRLLEVVAGSPARVRLVRFAVDGRVVATDRSGAQGVWAASARLTRGRHALTATAVDGRGRTAGSRRMVSVCSA
ncbi:MAG TPA: hypothetical protein VGK79_17980, partial [Gaiellaceae bacterium]